jgi:YgiT-type zinc finger domain-containing protein
MAGKREKKPKKCALCGGSLRNGTTTIPFLVDERVVVIKDVPAEVCTDCGEAYMKSSVVEKVESVLDRLEELHSEMSVVHFEVA